MKYKKFRWLRFVDTPPVEGGGDTGAGPGEAGKPVENPEAPTDDKLGEGGLKALQTERAARAVAEKTARDAQAALDAERNAHAATRQEADAAKLEQAKSKAAFDAGLPPAFASRLHGSTKEELEADAAELKKSLFVPPVDPSQGKDRGGDGGGTVEAGKSLYDRMHGKKSK